MSKDDPILGVLDYLVERNLNRIARVDLESYIGTSGLTDGAGIVDVVPVIGTRSDRAPQNYLAKLARGMVEAVTDDGSQVPVTQKIAEMLDEMEARRAYDLVLIDSRAGLAEVAAGPLLGLGAHVLLFATAQRQTVDGLRFLFAHLASLVREGQRSPWQGLKMVHAKAQSIEGAAWLREECADLFSDYLYEEQEGLEGFNFDLRDPDAPHSPVAIPLEQGFADWDPTDRPSNLTAAYYERTFGDLLKFVRDSLPGGDR